VHGFSLHVNTRVPVPWRHQFERFIRSTARDAVALKRIQEDANGDFVYPSPPRGLTASRALYSHLWNCWSLPRRRGGRQLRHGGGGRHAPLATGDTVTKVAQLAGLAAPNTVVMRQVTARRAPGTCALEDVGSQVRTGVADPRGVFRVHSPTIVASAPFLSGRDEARGWLVRHWEAPEGAFPSKRLVDA